jgi:hypothetical protein
VYVHDFVFLFLRVAPCCVCYYDLFGGAVNRNNVLIVFIFLLSFYTPLHISALMGHLQVEYTQSLMEAMTPKRIRFLAIQFIHILVLASNYVIYCLIFKIKITNNVLK